MLLLQHPLIWSTFRIRSMFLDRPNLIHTQVHLSKVSRDIKIEMKEANEINAFLTEKLRSEQGILKTSTLLAFEQGNK